MKMIIGFCLGLSLIACHHNSDTAATQNNEGLPAPLPTPKPTDLNTLYKVCGNSVILANATCKEKPNATNDQTCANISDPMLYVAIRGALKLSAGQPITKTAVEQLTTLDATTIPPKVAITDLSGIECLVAVKTLNLTGSKVSDFSPLSKLPTLQTLTLHIPHNA